MSPTLRLSAALLVSVGFLRAAEPDPEALARQRAQLERNFDRESQKIDQANEQAMIPLNAKRRELSAKIDRDNSTSLNLASYLASDGKTGLDIEKLKQVRFEQLEGSNQIDRQMFADIEEATQAKRDALDRRRNLERAKFDANAITGSEDAAKLRDEAIKRAEITAKWQEKIDALNREGRRAEFKLSLERHTAINHQEAEIFATEQKAAADAMRQLNKGGDPKTNNMLTVAQKSNELTQPLKAKRDEAVNALETALEELRANYSVRRTDLENERDDEIAKVQP
jgi:hypothetical protein